MQLSGGRQQRGGGALVEGKAPPLARPAGCFWQVTSWEIRVCAGMEGMFGEAGAVLASVGSRTARACNLLNPPQLVTSLQGLAAGASKEVKEKLDL